jgi:hypothetical protein
MINRRILIALSSSLLFFAACKKKDDGKPAAASGPIANTADYEARGNALFDKMISIFQADGKECDKLAADLNKFMDDSKSDMEAMTTYDKAHPADKEAFNKKIEARADDLMKALAPAMEACKDNKALADAMAKMPKG